MLITFSIVGGRLEGNDMRISRTDPFTNAFGFLRRRRSFWRFADMFTRIRFPPCHGKKII